MEATLSVMRDSADLAPLIIGAFLLSCAAIIAVQLLSGAINTRYLLYGMRKDGSRYFSAERVQLLVITLWVALNYVTGVIGNPHLQALPDVPSQILALFGGSQALYLGGKAYARFAAPSS